MQSQKEVKLSHKLLRDAKFYELLLRLDCDLARQAQVVGCPCSGRLHRADYPRKARGGPEALEGYERRFSFCCERDGCRKRCTPPSLRFLGRRVYLGAVVVLLSAMTQGLTGRRAARLRALVGVDRRTLERWRRWWRETFATTAVWKVLRGRWVVAPATAELPAALLERVVGGLDRQVLSLLMWLVPLTTSTCSMMVDLDPQRMLVAWSERGR